MLNAYASQSDSYNSEYESTVDSVINYNINECNFWKVSYDETESDIAKPANAEFVKTINRNWESNMKNNNRKSEIYLWKSKSPENCVFVPPKVNLELSKLLRSWQRKYRKF